MSAAVTVLAALAEPARLQIMAVLGDASRCVCDINAEMGLAENLLSYHLRVLHQAGLVERTRQGRWVRYRIAAGAAVRVADALSAAGLHAVVAQPAGAASTCDEGRRG